MSLQVDVHIDVDDNASLFPVEDVRAAAILTLENQGVVSASVSVILTGHKTVRELNAQYLDHHYNTDVLSFVLSDADEVLEGEVYVDVQTAAERCGEFDASLENEITRYVIHGVLHLTGLDDSTDAEKNLMTALENEILSVLASR